MASVINSEYFNIGYQVPQRFSQFVNAVLICLRQIRRSGLRPDTERPEGLRPLPRSLSAGTLKERKSGTAGKQKKVAPRSYFSLTAQ